MGSFGLLTSCENVQLARLRVESAMAADCIPSQGQGTCALRPTKVLSLETERIHSWTQLLLELGGTSAGLPATTLLNSPSASRSAKRPGSSLALSSARRASSSR